jgi:hypothetical protein
MLRVFPNINKKMEDTMFKAALGLTALAGIALVTPALAQGVYLDAPGVSVGVGERHHYRSYDHPRYRSSYGVRSYDDDYAYAGNCRTTKIYRSDGSVKTVRRCR